MTTPSDIEERLTDTLRSVAEQIDPISPEQGRYVETASLSRGGGRSNSRTVWLAVAAVLVAGFAAVGYSAYDRVTPTEAASSTTPEPVTVDGLLYLLPPEDFPLSGDVEFEAGEVSAENDLSAMAVGRQTESGYEDLYAIFHSTEAGSFSINPDSAQMVGDRKLFDSFDEGVGEQLDDDTWIIYQTEFDDPQLERLVGSTGILDGELSFTDPEGVLDVVAFVADVKGSLNTTVSSFPDTNEPPGPGGPVLGFVMITSDAKTPEEALYYATSLAARDLQEVVVEDTGQVLHIGHASFGLSLVAWSPAEGKAAAAMVIGGDEQTVVDFITGMRIVDADTWEAELSGQG